MAAAAFRRFFRRCSRQGQRGGRNDGQGYAFMPGIPGEPFPAAGRAGQVQNDPVKGRIGAVPVAFPVFRGRSSSISPDCGTPSICIRAFRKSGPADLFQSPRSRMRMSLPRSSVNEVPNLPSSSRSWSVRSSGSPERREQAFSLTASGSSFSAVERASPYREAMERMSMWNGEGIICPSAVPVPPSGSRSRCGISLRSLHSIRSASGGN